MANNSELLQQVTQYRIDSTQNISRQTARLYSNFTRLRQGQKGVVWDENDTNSLLDDAYNLIEAGLIEREFKNELEYGDWVKSLRRAGEILEWLSLPELQVETKIPTRLLAASVYQIAGYPARSATLLRPNHSSQDSEILRKFLKGEFYELFSDVTKYWGDLQSTDATSTKSIEATLIDTTVRSIGVIIGALRWPDEHRVEIALGKFLSIAALLSHSDSSTSWFLAKLTAISSQKYISSSFRNNLKSISIDQTGTTILEKYYRQRFLNNQILAWPSQLKGITALQERRSCVIFTPTGSGKTTIAEIAILKGLFSAELTNRQNAPIVVYLVPKRALAADVESRLSKLFQNIAEPNPIIVTGLYGGSDWGPTDAWITRDNPVVLICTYEKAEALSRFLGSIFLDRISLVILDEAHFVQAEKVGEGSLDDNRQLNLEIIGTRLFRKVRENNGQIIGLSAVAKGIEKELSQWVEYSKSANAEKSDYHSTRHLIGCLECRNRGFTIYYDLLDGQPLRILDNNEQKEFPPYVPNPFPLHPPVTEEWEPTPTKPKPEKSLRPYTLWAAMQFASSPKDPKMVLISVPQKPEEHGKDFLRLIKEVWKQQSIPKFFKAPTDRNLKQILQRALACCADYFGENSLEYQLLKRGIVLHHGKLPSLLSRLLIDVIEKKIVRIVLSTTTLSDGMNLPFDIVLIPSVKRVGKLISSRDIINLAGRAGRPGVSNEGICLILESNYSNQKNDYHSITSQLLEEQNATAKSSLEALIDAIHQKWLDISSENSRDEDFLEWLEQIPSTTEDGKLSRGLEILDKTLISFLNDVESIENEDPLEMETKLRTVWMTTYASFTIKTEGTLLPDAFIARAKGITKSFIPTRAERRAIYYTNLPPSSGKKLIDLYDELKQLCQEGYSFSDWNDEQKIEYIFKLADRITTIPEFIFSESVPENSAWQQVLRWWLLPGSLVDGRHGQNPSQDKIANWYQYVHQNFIYKLNWGLSSFIGYAAHDTTKGSNLPVGLSVDDWPQLDLPWVVFWLKEMITWGTIDPVAAFLLGHGGQSIFTRWSANSYVQDYYLQLPSNLDANDKLDAGLIRSWATTLPIFSNRESNQYDLPARIRVSLKNSAPENIKRVHVLPYRNGNKLHWFDPAGFYLAECEALENWNDNWVMNYDFVLETVNEVVMTDRYL